MAGIKYRELVGDALIDMNDEHQRAAKSLLKEKIREIRAAELVLAKMKDDMEKLLDREIDEYVFSV